MGCGTPRARVCGGGAVPAESPRGAAGPEASSPLTAATRGSGVGSRPATRGDLAGLRPPSSSRVPQAESAFSPRAESSRRGLSLRGEQWPFVSQGARAGPAAHRSPNWGLASSQVLQPSFCYKTITL